MKLCPKCKTTRPLDAFSKRPNGNLQSHCKPCGSLRAAEWHKANAEKTREATRKYQEANRELINARQRAARAGDPGASRAAVKKWQTLNKQAYDAARKRWADENPGKCRAQEARRRAAKLRATPPWFDPTKVTEVYELAREFRDAGLDVHVDHVVPLRGRNVCGLHTHQNLRLLLAPSNQVKSNKFVQEYAEV